MLDAKQAKIVSTWSLGDCKQHTGLALDKAHRRMFPVCRNGVMVVLDADTRRCVARLPIGAGPDGAVFYASRGLAYSANGQEAR